MKDKTRVEIPEKAKIKMQILFSQKQAADLQFSSFVDGCFQALQLEGDWDLNTQEWVFTFRPKQEKTEEK